MLNPDKHNEASFVRAPHVERSYCKGGAALWDPQSDAYFHLNDTGAEIWEHLSQPSSLRKLLGKLSRDFEATPEQMQDSVERMLRDLMRDGLVLRRDSSTS